MPLLQRIPTHDEDTAVCVEIETPLGKMLVYGTIIPYGVPVANGCIVIVKKMYWTRASYGCLSDTTIGTVPACIAGTRPATIPTIAETARPDMANSKDGLKAIVAPSAPMGESAEGKHCDGDHRSD